ncbi:MAG: hypothetical protein WBQ25_22665 [Nitrososphaeraceae archaeon]|jgi:hypothetical protein
MNKLAVISLLLVISGALIATTTNTANKIAFAQVQGPICPSSHVQHWDNIVFFIKSPNLAGRLHLVTETELGIKVLDDPHKVADIKQKVLDFLNVPTEPRDSIHILEVGYAVICAE